MTGLPGVKATKDGGLIIHPSITAADSNIGVPQTSTIGAGFGDTISDNDRAWAACREPIAHFLTHIVADDMTDKWFTIEDPDTEEADPALDRTVQQEFAKLKLKYYLNLAVKSARTFRRSLLVGAFNDAKTISDLAKPKALNAELMQLDVYPEIYQEQKVKEFQVDSIDTNPLSPRYGKPVTYKLMRQSMNETGTSTSDNLIIHYTRVCEVGTGTSVLDIIWDDMSSGRNIRWGFGQYVYRIGGAFPVLSFPSGTTVSQLEAYGASGAFNNLMSKTYILLAQNATQENTGMTFEFKGAQGATLDPIPFFTQNIQQIAIATGCPQAKLIGAQAGAVTGSEVNQQEYYKAISRDQIAYCEEPIRWVINRLIESGKITLIKTATDKTAPNYHLRLLKATLKRALKRDYRHKTADQYIIEWNSAFELSELDEAQIELTHVSALEKKLGWMSKDEIRAEEGLDPLPDGAGEWKDQSAAFGGEQFLVQTKQGMKQPNAKPNEKPTTDPNSTGSPASNQ